MAEALLALYQRGKLGMVLGLDAMRAASARVDNPERAFDVVHVAGTNGKGSTCAMIEAMARAGGLRTGLYTSPHLCRFAERIRIDGEPIDDATLESVLARALEAGPELSFFEAATLAALLAFRDAKVDLAILEVGLGGRLDATNIVPPPRCAAITRIALDHQEMLGDTIDAIAREKAAIAKAGSPLVVARNDDDARRAIHEIAEAAGATIVDLAETDLGAGGLPASPRGLLGAFQRENAETAWVVARTIGIGVRAREQGLASARWPGRFERVDVRSGALAGPWLLDGAHNPDGARALSAALDASQLEVSAIVFGALAEKAWPEMLDAVAGAEATQNATRIYVTPSAGAGPSGSTRAAADLAELAERQPGQLAPSVEAALAAARKAASRPGAAPLVLICGSLYLVGAARSRLMGLPRDPPIAL